MSLLRARRGLGDSNSELIPSRSTKRVGSVNVDLDSALHQSVVWDALVTRADMVSTLPLDVFRQVGKEQVEVPKPPIFINPQGDGSTFREFLWSSQFDLDSVGNNYGIISKTDGAGRPAEIQLVDHRTVTVIVARATGVITYRIAGVTYAESEIWHERQFRVSGMVMGLSPLAYAAWSVGLYQSAEAFALDWFANGGGQTPSGHYKNTSKTLLPAEAQSVKDRTRETFQRGEVLVSGNDWEFTTINSQAKDAEFLSTQQNAELAIARYFGVPGDLLDVQGNASSVTYANVQQRNLQFLIFKLQPTLTRREDSLSKLLAAPRFVKFNTDAILRMDPQTKATVIAGMVAAKLLTVTEGRALDNRAPYTDEQWAEFDRISPKPVPALTSTKGASL